MEISIFFIIDFILALMILSVPTLAVNAIIKIAAIIVLCILLSINNQKLIKKIKENSVTKGLVDESDMHSNRKKDEGFEFLYWKLSYYRKYKRTLFFIPIGLLVSVFVHERYHNWWLTWGYIALIIIIGSIQAIYNYKKWKNEKEK